MGLNRRNNECHAHKPHREQHIVLTPARGLTLGGISPSLSVCQEALFTHLEQQYHEHQHGERQSALPHPPRRRRRSSDARHGKTLPRSLAFKRTHPEFSYESPEVLPLSPFWGGQTPSV